MSEQTLLPDVIETPRLTLRPFRLDDVEDVRRFANDEEWSRYLRRIAATADERNLASHRVMEKIGMRREGGLRQARLWRGECIDEALFAVVRDDWEALRSPSE